MKKGLVGAMILSLVVSSTPSVYAEEVTNIKAQVEQQSIEKTNIKDKETSVSTTSQEVNNIEVGTEKNTNISSEQQTNILGQQESDEQPTSSQYTTGGLDPIGQPTDNLNNENPADPGQVASQDLSNKVVLTLNSKTALVEGSEVTLLAPPKIVNNTTLLPLRFIGEQVLGTQVNWDSATKTVSINKDGTNVVVTIGSKIAKLDGLDIELLAPPTIENNSTLLPLRFISEAFGITVFYDPVSKTITLTKPNQNVIPNQAPVASFSFPQTYIAGQTVSVIDTSSDPDGDPITEKLWSVTTSEKTVTNKELSNMFKTPRAGSYTIGLQVKDSKGLWSEWSYQTITIEENKPPVITGLTSSKSSYAQGEKLDFSYTYSNEEWETVKEGKWTYRSINDAPNRAALGKPDVLFTEGDYIVTFYLDDAYGNRSEAAEVTVHITDEVKSTELNYRFTQGAIGDWIDNFKGTNYLNFEPVNVLNKYLTEGTLIMSDSPEEVQGQGTLYKGKMNGNGRVLIHHINKIQDTSDTQRLAFLVENPTDMPVTVTLMNKSIKGPATDILRVGQLCLNEYLSGSVPVETITLMPGEKKSIYEKNWAYNTCISGQMDVQTTGEVNFIVANLSKAQTIQDLDQLMYHMPDGVHYSGTYTGTGLTYELNLDGTRSEKLILGVVNSGEWITGYDDRTGLPVENTGNFGASYYINVTAQEDMGVILNNRGGTFQGAIKWNDKVYNMPGKGSFIGTTTKAVTMGIIKKGETVKIEYFLPNGSAAPTLIGFIPRSEW